MDKRPYNIEAFENLIKKIQRETPLRRTLVESLMLHIKYGIKWLNYDIYPITINEFLSDQRRLKDMLIKLIHLYKEHEPENYQKFVSIHTEIIEYE